MSDYIPDSVLNRRKQGFSSPDESWYRGENAEYIKEILINSKTISTKYIRKSYIKKIVNEHINDGKNHRLLIWSFLCFEIWCQTFLNDKNNIKK